MLCPIPDAAEIVSQGAGRKSATDIESAFFRRKLEKIRSAAAHPLFRAALLCNRSGHERGRMGWDLPRLSLMLGLSALPLELAHAQMNLSGATLSGSTIGTFAAPGPGAPALSKPKAAFHQQAPGPAAVVGRELQFNGRHGLIALELPAKAGGAARGKGKASAAGDDDRAARDDLRVSKLVLPGDSIARPGEACRVEVTGEPISARHLGKVDGLHQYEVGFKACPFRFSLLDGAILASAPTSAGTCDIPDGDCRVTPAGLWGPPGRAVSAAASNLMDKTRARTEADARTAFRTLLSRIHDRDRIKAFAAEQAGFSSKRQEACADYDSEDANGFCALHLTQARLAALTAQLDQTDPHPKHMAQKPGTPRRVIRNPALAPAPSAAAQ